MKSRAAFGYSLSGRHGRGFTLIELMIVISIIGILASLSYASYRDYVQTTRRSDAHIALMHAIQAAKRYRSENGSYAGFDSSDYSSASPDGHYSLTSASVGAAGPSGENMYFWAVPVGTGLQADDECQMFVLSTAGETAVGRRYATTPGCEWD